MENHFPSLVFHNGQISFSFDGLAAIVRKGRENSLSIADIDFEIEFSHPLRGDIKIDCVFRFVSQSGIHVDLRTRFHTARCNTYCDRESWFDLPGWRSGLSAENAGHSNDYRQWF